MVDTSILVFSVMMAISFIVIILGFITRKSMISIMGALIMIIMSVALTGFIVATESVYVEGVVDEEITGWHYENTTSYLSLTSSAASDVNTATRKIFGEFASSGSSLLVGDLVNCMEVGISKTGTPSNVTSDAIVGVFNSTGGLVYQFGTQEETSLTTSHIIRTYCNTDTIHTMASQDRIGVKFELADATNKVQIRSDGAGQFDGTTTYTQTFASGAWGSTTANDLMAKTYYRENVTDTEVIIIEAAQWIDHDVVEPINMTTKIIIAFLGIIFFITPLLTFKGFTI